MGPDDYRLHQSFAVWQPIAIDDEITREWLSALQLVVNAPDALLALRPTKTECFQYG